MIDETTNSHKEALMLSINTPGNSITLSSSTRNYGHTKKLTLAKATQSKCDVLKLFSSTILTHVVIM